MTAQRLLASFDPATARPVYLLCPGKASERQKNASFEPHMAECAAQHMVNALVEPSLRDLAYNAYHADDTDPAEVIAVANTLPFLTERRVILVRGVEAYETDAAIARLLPYLENPCESSVVILIANQIDQRRKLFKTCDKGGFVVPCPQLNENEVKQWAAAELAALGKRADGIALGELVNRAGLSLSDVKNALQLVANFVGERDAIRQEDVVAACADVAEDTVWALTDAIAASDVKKALTVLRQLFEFGKSEFELLGTINWLLKTAYEVAVSPPNSPRTRGFAQQKCIPLANKFGPAKLGDAFALLTETDFLLRSTGTDKALMIELLVIKLATPRAARRANA